MRGHGFDWYSFRLRSFGRFVLGKKKIGKRKFTEIIGYHVITTYFLSTMHAFLTTYFLAVIALYSLIFYAKILIKALFCVNAI